MNHYDIRLVNVEKYFLIPEFMNSDFSSLKEISDENSVKIHLLHALNFFRKTKTATPETVYNIALETKSRFSGFTESTEYKRLVSMFNKSLVKLRDEDLLSPDEVQTLRI